MASRLQDVLLRGLAAARPLATDVAKGTLYFSTDLGITEQSDGTNWNNYTDGAGTTSPIIFHPFLLMGGQMADAYKVLSQTNPSAATLTDSYTVPASTQTVISSITVCNRSATPTSFRISVAINGAADNNVQYIAFDNTIGANESIALTLGITVDATDVVRVFATLATLTFNVFGVERT